jgi:quercetin dioxygenase-like cupin family protein
MQMTQGFPQFALQKDEGESYWVLGDLYTFKLSSADTAGTLAVIETLTFPQNGPPMHTHTHEDETFYILDGRFSFVLGEQTFEASPGTLIRAPRGIPHGYKNISALPARKLLLISPAGLENFFREVGEPAKDTTAPPPHRPGAISRAMQLAQKYGLRIQLPEGLDLA